MPKQRASSDVIPTHYSTGNIGDAAVVQVGSGNTINNYFEGSAGSEELLCAPPDFIAGMLDERKSFHHSWQLIGRANALSELQDFVEDAEARLLLMEGVPGVGKTKLLYAFALSLQEKKSDWLPLFVHRGSPGIDVSQVPDRPTLIFADGPYAHTVNALLGDSPRRGRFKVIVATDSSKEEKLNGALRDVARGVEQRRTMELHPLETTDAQKLARLALGEKAEDNSAELVLATGGNPLLITLAGWLMTRRQMTLKNLSTHGDFRRELTDRFCRFLSGGSEEDEKLLQLLALLSPVRWDASIRRAAGEFLGMSSATLRLRMVECQARGAIQQRGNYQREDYVFLAPDVIADEYLQRACLNRDGRFDLYPQEVFAAFEGLWPSALLRNVARLDWRLGLGECAAGGNVFPA
jgi:DNA polymerase III delta prime subunit